MAHGMNPLDLSVGKQNPELYVVIRLVTNCTFDCSLQLASILRMHSLEPFFPARHSFSRIKSVDAVPFLRKMQCVPSCYLPSPTAHVPEALCFRKVELCLFEFFNVEIDADPALL